VAVPLFAASSPGALDVSESLVAQGLHGSDLSRPPQLGQDWRGTTEARVQKPSLLSERRNGIDLATLRVGKQLVSIAFAWLMAFAYDWATSPARRR
jgi:hypothetical protein